MCWVQELLLAWILAVLLILEGHTSALGAVTGLTSGFTRKEGRGSDSSGDGRGYNTDHKGGDDFIFGYQLHRYEAGNPGSNDKPVFDVNLNNNINNKNNEFRISGSYPSASISKYDRRHRHNRRTPRSSSNGGQDASYSKSPAQSSLLRSQQAHEFSTNVLDESLLESEILDYIESVTSTNHKNCSRTDLNKFNYKFKSAVYKDFSKQENSVINVANTINNLFLYSAKGIKDRERLYDEAYYIALARAIVESDPNVYGCGIAFARDQYQGREYFCPYVREDYINNGTFVTDLAKTIKYASDTETAVGWFTEQMNKDYDRLVSTKHVLHSTDLGRKARQSLTWRWNATTKMTSEDGLWSQPYFSCHGVPTWMITYSVPFFDWEDGGTVFKGVVLIDIDLNQMDINQCAARGTGMFAETHRCRRESTMCEHLPGGGFRRGFYQCKCKERFHFPSTDGAADHFDGFDAEVAFLAKHRNLTSFNSYDQDFHCLPCGKGCTKCVNDSSCIVEYNILIRGIPLGIQSFCMTITIVLGFVIVRLRKAKVMITSMWVMMEILLLGALMLYSTVVAQYFEPTTMTCLIVPWFREVGFVVMYGALVLKLYRLLSEFQSRKAHRVHVRDKDLLKYLCCIIFVVLGYMAAWSAINMDHIHDGKSVLDVGRIDNGLQFTVCRAFWWDYVIETIELLFLFFGIYLCYCTRSAPSDYGEGRYISIALYNETIMCVLLYGSRHFLWLSLHPDYMFLLYFLRCQFTVTVTLILVLGPKLWFAHRPPEDDHFRSRTYSTSDVHDSVSPETMKLSVAISSNGDVDVGEVNLAEMDPEDIRSELKRLYTQLQVYKTKTMRKDNPHISKRRGGRKQTHRRFSLQAFHHKHRHHHEQDHDHELSKTPEDSTNSAEMTIQMEGVSVTEDHCHESGSRRDRDREGRSAPYVTFKSGVK